MIKKKIKIDICFFCLLGILLTLATSGALKATRPKFKIATSSTTTTSTTPLPTTDESNAKENEDNLEVSF